MLQVCFYSTSVVECVLVVSMSCVLRVYIHMCVWMNMDGREGLSNRQAVYRKLMKDEDNSMLRKDEQMKKKKK